MSQTRKTTTAAARKKTTARKAAPKKAVQAVEEDIDTYVDDDVEEDVVDADLADDEFEQDEELDDYDEVHDDDLDAEDFDDDEEEDDDLPETIVRFEQYRKRALKVSGGQRGKTPVTNKPFVLGKSDGFKEPVRLHAPDFNTRLGLGDAFQQGDQVRIMRLIFKQDIYRVMGVLTQYEKDQRAKGRKITGEEILAGILFAYIEHFYGQGAMDQGFLNALS